MATRFFERLSKAQVAHPFRWILAAFVLGLAAFPWVLQLELSSDFQAMLPETAPSVRDLDEIRSRFGGMATLTLAVQAREGHTIDEAHAFVRELVPRIEAMEELHVTTVDWNVSDFETFVTDHRFLYADLSDLTEIRDSLSARLEYERARANPFYIDLGDEAPPDPEAVIQRIQADAERARSEMDRFPGGFYQHPDQPIVFVFIRTSIRGGENGAIDRLIAAVEQASAEVAGAEPTLSRTAGTSAGLELPAVRIDYGGDTMDIREENEALKEAVEYSTLLTLVLLLASIYVFFFRWRAAFLLVITLVPPILVTFGLAEPVVDSLNASSAFLGSIVVGNGINSSIMWLGRYFEERRDGKGAAEAVLATHLGTWTGTLAAALAAACAYGSLMVTTYRGFRDFGLIGAIGMVVCWVAAYLLLPALVLATERLRPLVFDAREKERRGVYGVFFARLALGPSGAEGTPRAYRQSLGVALGSLVLTGLALAAIAVAVRSDPLEYDFRRLQSVRPAESRVSWVNERVGETVEETRSGSALAILSPTVDDVPALVEQLTAYREAHPTALGAVRTIDDLMPHDVEAKLPLLAELRSLLLDVRPHLSEARQQQVDENLPPEHIEPVTREMLPDSVARAFRERDGTRGRLVFVEHADGRSTWDGRYMIEWAEAVRSVHTHDGRRPAVAGTAVVFADLLSTLYSDGPVTIGFSLLTTLILLALSFKKHGDRAYAFVSMMVGTVWMTGVLAVLGMKLNFLNMVAFPVTFGIGLEYGVNYVKRFREECDAGRTVLGAAREALEGAGGAVVLCSLTTLIGYVSLFVSTNQALNSFGYAMTASEVTCLAAAVLTVPAVIAVLAARARTPSPEAKSAELG